MNITWVSSLCFCVYRSLFNFHQQWGTFQPFRASFPQLLTKNFYIKPPQNSAKWFEFHFATHCSGCEVVHTHQLLRVQLHHDGRFHFGFVEYFGRSSEGASRRYSSKDTRVFIDRFPWITWWLVSGHQTRDDTHQGDRHEGVPIDLWILLSNGLAECRDTDSRLSHRNWSVLPLPVRMEAVVLLWIPWYMYDTISHIPSMQRDLK